MMSAASYRNLRDRRSVLALGFHLSPVGLVERLYWFPRPPGREISKLPIATQQELYLVIFDGRTEREPIRN